MRSVDHPASNATAHAFVAARNAGRALLHYPGLLPATLDEAYRIQNRAVALSGGTVAGWKVGRIPDPLVARYGADRLAGPVFAGMIVEGMTVEGGGGEPEMPVFGEGFAAAEAEYLLRIGHLPAPGEPITNAVAAACIDRVCVGIEIASSPFVGINDHGPAVTISDFGNNNGLVVGEAVPGDEALLGWPVRLAIDGALAGEARAADMLDGPFGAARFLFELAIIGQIKLVPGQWISSGAVTGVHRVRPGQRVEAVFDGRLTVRCRIGAIPATDLDQGEGAA